MKEKLTENEKISRRKFFRFSAALAAGVPLAGCLSTAKTNTRADDDLNPDKPGFVQVSDDTPVRLDSPNGQVRIDFFLQADQGVESVPHYRVFFNNKPLLSASRLSVGLTEGSSLGGSCSVESVKINSGYIPYTMFPGKRSHIIDHFTEAVVTLNERTSGGRRWEVVLRAYDDGAAFRYRFPDQNGWTDLEIRDEQTEFNLSANARAFALPFDDFTSHAYEVFYEKKEIREIPEDWLLGLPLLVECPDCGWMAITEANLRDYAGMYLAPSPKSEGTLISRLSPLPNDQNVAVRASLPHESPWRVVMVGQRPEELIESDLVVNLSDPSVIEDTSWIKPGKTTFPWWNGYYLEDVPFKGGLNTATMKHYIDFCAEHGIEYHSLDGFEGIAWHGGPTRPYEGADITTAIPGIDMPEVIRYAKEKNVGLRLWMHWESVKEHMDEAFPIYRAWGIEGVMIDFMNRDDQEMVNFLEKVFQKAAENHLTVTLHGAHKPTGLERKYPNLLNSEAVRNLEYNKFREEGIPPEHEVIFPFIRMLAGPLDYHQGGFRGVSIDNFKQQGVAPVVMGTISRTLAGYVVFQNHLPMVADYPYAYRYHPEALAMIKKIPVSWDDTKVLEGSIGEYIIIARRAGSDWFVGVMNDSNSRKFELSLDFLKPGNYQAEICMDDASAKDPYQKNIHQVKNVKKNDVLKVRLVPAGGYFLRLSPSQ